MTINVNTTMFQMRGDSKVLIRSFGGPFPMIQIQTMFSQAVSHQVTITTPSGQIFGFHSGTRHGDLTTIGGPDWMLSSPEFTIEIDGDHEDAFGISLIGTGVYEVVPQSMMLPPAPRPLKSRMELLVESLQQSPEPP